MMGRQWTPLAAALLLLLVGAAPLATAALGDDERVCPTVRAIRHLHLHDMLGHWYVVQYYASSEELPEYRCMRADFSLSTAPSTAAPGPRVTMNFTYAFSDDPMGERLRGNITWLLPDLGRPAHWRHQEESYQGVYNTYVLDSDYTTWALLLHCAEQEGSLRYLSSFILSREPDLPANVQAYLRDKLTRYAIDLEFMFPMAQDDCDNLVDIDGPVEPGSGSGGPDEQVVTQERPRPDRKHPMQRHHKPRSQG
ncbi:uncharacterized protein LOC113217797 isoform X1 [Frankliniella occidentalis]|uniref:Uncharacterized protein LOC113217797 isoform X1 n=2 Tax=Frankliniella occidentalis TaxID=133901 RepID=A0A6J1TPX3_FRAOC|nr:uncharacterized protein LOC113217797 isoform X1 [Frankliniella occidentalis]